MNEAPNWEIILIVAAQLGTIAVANGYYTDAGACLDVERMPQTETAAFPRIALGEETLTPTQQTTAAITRELVLVAEGYVAADQDHAERDAARLKADIGRALGRVSAATFADLNAAGAARVTQFEVTGDQPTLRAVGEAVIAVQVRATVTYTEYTPPVTG